jgi:NAD(P)-dependent dehydrogenase (short-subunit alcohol dehydrogenase family)
MARQTSPANSTSTQSSAAATRSKQKKPARGGAKPAQHDATAVTEREEKDARSFSDQQPKPPFPAQHQAKPGLESNIAPQPRFAGEHYRAAGKLTGKRALITGGDSGIGRSVAVFFAREGADVAINYLEEEQSDAEETQRHVEAEGRKCVLLPGDLCDADFCEKLVEEAQEELGGIDVLVSNAAYQNRKTEPESITDEEWDRTFQTNVYALFHLVRAALPNLPRGSSIIVTSSETGLLGNKNLLDYASTKGAINAFVKSLAQKVVDRGIRVNAVAPGPVWTPLNTCDEGKGPDRVSEFGSTTAYERPAQPEEIAPAYVFFASEADSSFITGHILPILGGKTVTD